MKNEQKRNELFKDIKNANDRLKQMNYTTSHDLRSPVSNILGIADLIDTENIKDNEAQELIKLLKEAAGSLTATLNQYLEDLKSHELLPVDLTSVDLNDVLNKVVSSIDTSIKQANAKIHVDFSGFSQIDFNIRYMESIFLNLITNSLKYAHPQRDPEIRVKTEIKSGQKKLLYSDNGIGFDSKKLAHKIFGLRQTFHDNKNSKGIGLYLVHTHVTSLGGKISVHSQPEEGTSFEIVFPE